MKRTNKKGFTLVELVIVIAVIAILAAVLIPTFSSLIRRANVTRDQELIRNLNTALLADKALNGQHKTMTEALAAAKGAGYDVGQINKNATNNEILWDSQNDLFCYFNADNNNQIEYLPNQTLTVTDLHDVDYFQIIDVKASDATEGVADMTAINYSIYLRDVDATVTAVTHNKGVDVGVNTVSVNYTYTNTDEQNVIIRTNGASSVLTIDDHSTGTIYHHGEAGSLNIIECHVGSYHEFGQVANAQIQTGRIVIESNKAEIANLLLIAKADKSGFEEIIVETKTGATLPTFDRTEVDIAPNGTLVLNVVTPSSDEYIYLTKAGVIEQIVVTTEDVNTATTNVTAAASAKAASETSETTYTVSQQVANVGQKNDQGKYVDGNGDPVELDDLTSVEQIVTEAKATQEDIEKGKTVFEGGAGVEVSPYLIANVEQFKKIQLDENQGKYFQLTNNITLDLADFTENSGKAFITSLNGGLNGNGYRIIITNKTNVAMNESSIHRIFNQADGILKNFTIVNDTGNVVSIVGGADDASTADTIYHLTFDNVNYGYEDVGQTLVITTNNTGLYTQTKLGHLTFVNCSNYYNIDSSASYTGIFAGGRVSAATPTAIIYSFDNCNNYGNISAVNFGILVGNGNGNRTTANTTIIGCANHGLFIVTSTYGFIGGFDETYDANFDSSEMTYSIIPRVVNDGTMLWSNGYQGSELYITKGTAAVETYVLRFFEGYDVFDGSNNKVGHMNITFEIEIPSASIEWDGNVGFTGYKRPGFMTSTRWQELTGQTITGDMYSVNSAGVKYFYDPDIADSNSAYFVIDVDSYFVTFKKANGLNNSCYFDTANTGIAIASLFGYDSNGDLVAYSSYVHVD